MREYDPCMGCKYYNKPYWSVVSPCASCPRIYGTGSCVTTTTTNIKVEKHNDSTINLQEVSMDIESLKAELQSQIDTVKNKWKSICEEEYGGDMEKLYNERAEDIIKDIKPIWELSVQINGMEVREKLLNVEDIK